MSTRSAGPIVIGASFSAAVAVIVIGTVLLGGTGYVATSIGDPGRVTSLCSAVLRVIVVLASSVTVGALFYAAFIRVRRGGDRLTVQNGLDLAAARHGATVWVIGALLLIPVDAADANGVPLTRLLTPGALPYLVSASYVPGAWIFATACAFVVLCVTFFARAWQSVLVCLMVSVLGVLSPVVVAQVLVGPNHDFGGDAAILSTPAMAVLFGAAVVYLSRRTGGPQPARGTTMRLFRVAAVCLVVTAAGDAVICLFELSGQSVLISLTGRLFLLQFVLLLAVALVGLTAWGRFRSDREASGVGAVPVMAVVGLLAAYAGVAALMTRIPPPVYFVPTTIAQNFLGYDITTTPTLPVFLFDWRPNILFITVSAVGSALYLIGVSRLRRRGDAWPAGRTVSWLLGWTAVVLTTSSGLGRYANGSFSAHMVLHMSLNMLVPILLTLGGPTTLALRATTARRPGEPAGPHEWITGLLNWKLLRGLYNPLIVFVSFIGSYYLVYFTDIFYQASRYHWAHQLLDIHFIMVGYLFYSLVIGVDQPPRQLPHIGKLGLVLAAMPFHAFFGVIVMTSDTVIAKLFYQYLGEPWATNLRSDQYLGGGIAWSAGELPLLVVVIALVTQWTRQDRRLAARTDRHLDSGIDDSFETYNAMLAQLAHRDERQTRTVHELERDEQ